MRNTNHNPLRNIEIIRYLVHITVSIIALIVLIGCISQANVRDSSPEIPIRSLIIDATIYPQGWRNISYQESDEDASIYDIDNASAFFQYKSYRNELSVHEVLHFSSPAYAKEEFESRRQHDANRGVSLFLPPEISYTSQIASRTSVQCFTVESEVGSGIDRCNVYAQYESYLSVFNCPIGNQIMSYADFNNILREVDKKMEIVAK